MSETRWTVGPWRVNSSWIEGPKMALRVAAVDWPGRGCAPHTVEEAKANARLIAAAPELARELADMRNRFWKALVFHGTDPEYADEACRSADAALAKAKGE